MWGTVGRGAVLVLSATFVTGCQDASPATPDSQDRLSQVCETFDVGEVDGLMVPAAAETRMEPEAFLDGDGRCTVRLHGGRALALEVDFADSQAAQTALADERGRTEDLSVAGATGFAGPGGTFDRNGGRAVLGDDERVVRVTIEPSLIVEGADPARVAGDVAIVVLTSLTTQEAQEAEGAAGPSAAAVPYCGGLGVDLVEGVLPEVEVTQRGVPLSPRLGERDPRGNCTLDGPDGRPLLEVIVDAPDTSFADRLRSRDSWPTETVEGQDGAGWAGRLGAADDAGGYAVLEGSDAIASVTVHQAREGRDVARDALAVARAALDVVEPGGG